MKLLILLSFFMGSMAFAADTYLLDQAHTNVEFSVKHMMLSNVKGRFDKVEGSFQFDEGKKEVSKIDITINTKSVDTNNKDRDTHLMSPDFFDVDKFSTMTFKSDKTVKFAGGNAQVPGILTLHGKSLPVVLETEYAGSMKDPKTGKTKVAFSAKTKIDRKDFGLTWNKNLDKGGVAVSDVVQISLDGEANQK